MNLSKFKSEDDAVAAFDVMVKGRKLGLSNADLAPKIVQYLKDGVQSTALLVKNLQRDLRESSLNTTPERLYSAQFYFRMKKRT